MPKPKSSVKTAIKSALSSENDGTEASLLRNKLFHQGFTVTDINVKLSVLRKKGEILLESGAYKLAPEFNKSKKTTKQSNSTPRSSDKTKVCHGYPKNSDVAITNRLFNDNSKTAQYTRNEVPLNVMLGSIDTFKKFKAGDGTNVMCSQNKFDTDYTKILQLRPSVE